MQIEVKNLQFSYGSRPLFRELQLTLLPGEFTWLLGPNGCGKSTLLKLLSGELTPVRGEINLGGRPLSAFSARERAATLAVVSQNTPADVQFTVQEYLLLGRCARRSAWRGATAQDFQITGEALEKFQLLSLQNKPCDALSGGEFQRVRLASAYAAQTPVLLLDEPTAALDPAQSCAVLEILRELAQTRTILLISHDLQQGANYADRLLFLKAGQLAGDGRPEKVLTPQQLQKIYDIPFTVERTCDRHWAIVPHPQSHGENSATIV